MLKKLDWYILKKFFTTFVFTITLLTFITVIIDTSEKADDFVKSGLSTKDIITHYYFGFIPHIISLLFPLFVFISVIYFTSKMAGRSEIVAILASGTSFNRFLRPYGVGAVVLAAILWLGFRYVTPAANKLRTDFQTKYVDGNIAPGSSNSSTFYFRNDSTHYGQIAYFDTTTKRGSGFTMQKIVNNQLFENLRAETLVWDTAKRKWKLENIIIHHFDSGRESLSQEKERYINLNFRPSEMKKNEYTKNVLTTPELNDFINKEKLRGAEGINEFLVERYHRDATPFALLILTLIGVSMSSRKVRGGSGLHIAIGIVTAALFILLDRFATIFSTKSNFPPLLAAWTPNIIFFIVAVYLYIRAPK